VTWHSIIAQLRAVPWAALVQQAQTVAVALLVWQLTKHHYAREWGKWAPEKAREVIAELRLALSEETRRRKAAEAEAALLRGMIDGARARLQRPRQLELVERIEVRR
jgi:hypothetical protein